jgi:hypothetical protein
LKVCDENCACLAGRFLKNNRHLIEIIVKLLLRNSVLGIALSLSTTAFASVGQFPASGPTVPGNDAVLRNGVAHAPVNAPVSVKRAIWAANQLRTKPYRFGGGHKKFHDTGYDCSGTVSYALAGAGLVSIPMNSKEFRNYGTRGPGKWITVYARNGHTFAVIAGLRLDTTSPHNPSRRWAPRWQPTERMPRGFEARHPVGL